LAQSIRASIALRIAFDSVGHAAIRSGPEILNRDSDSADCPSASLGVRQYISALLAPAGASGPNADATLGQLRLAACAIAALADIYICYRLARPVPGIGILLPGFAAAMAAAKLFERIIGIRDTEGERAVGDIDGPPEQEFLAVALAGIRAG
jgi:hypothetical protein